MFQAFGPTESTPMSQYRGGPKQQRDWDATSAQDYDHDNYKEPYRDHSRTPQPYRKYVQTPLDKVSIRKE